MKNIFFILAFSLVLLSCDKDSDSNNPTDPGTATPSLRFTANGKAYEWNYTYQQTATRSVGLVKNTSGEYSLSALSDNDYLHLGLPTKLLLEKTYTYTHGSTVINGFTEAKLTDLDPLNLYRTANSNDAITVVINSISNELATGTFTARLSVSGTPAKTLTITNGAFTNIRVLP